MSSTVVIKSNLHSTKLRLNHRCKNPAAREGNTIVGGGELEGFLRKRWAEEGGLSHLAAAPRRSRLTNLLVLEN